MSTEFERQKELIDTEISSIDDVYGFYLRYFKTFDGTHYFFMKSFLIFTSKNHPFVLSFLMLIKENKELKSKLKE